MQIHPQQITKTQVQDSQMIEVGSEEKLLKTKLTVFDRAPVSQEALNTYLKQNHPTDADDKFYDCSNCYGVDTGFNCCCSTEFQSDINQYGAGVTIYFRFLKQIALYFLLFAVLSIPQLIFSISCAKDTLTLNSILMGTTLGSLSLQGDSCIKWSWDDVLHNANITLETATILEKTTFKCPSGTISSANFVIGFIQESSSSIPCTYYDPSQAIVNCTKASSFSVIENKCIGQASCEFLITEDLFESCPNLHTNNVYAYAFCQDSEFSIGGLKIKNNTVAIICGYIDLLIVLLTAIFLFTLERQEQETIKNVNESEVYIENFSLEFQNLPENTKAIDLYLKLMEIEKQLENKFKTIQNFHIIDIQFSKGNQSILLGEEKAACIKKRNNMVRRFEAKYKVATVTTMDLKMNLATAAINQVMQDISKELSQNALDDLAEIAKLEDKIIAYDNSITYPQESNDIIKYAWITFETIEQRNLAYFLYQTDYIRDAFSCCGCSEILKIDNSIIRAQPAPPPDDINWSNLQFETMELFLRRTLSLLLTFILILFTIAAIVFLKYQQLSYSSNYPEPNCAKYSTINETDVIADQARKVKQGLLECYCKADFLGRINQTFTNGEKLCEQWFADYTKIIGWPFLIVLVIIVINSIISFIFTKFAEFEAHRSKSKQLSSRLLKVFCVQYINTALVILIINIRFRNELNISSFSVLLNGKFDDITVQWFNQVGTTILLTMLIYVVGPMINVFGLTLFRCLKRCFDTCGLDNGKFTRKLTQQDCNEYYTGSEFNVELRYSQVLTVICVNFLYSSGMPLLYLTTAMYLLLIYFCDKYTLLHFSKIPQKVDDSLAKLVREILKFLLIWHVIFSIWIYGSTKLFPETINFTQSISSNSVIQNAKSNVFGEFCTRAVTSQTIGLTCILILLVGYYILWPYLFNPVLRTIFFFCYSEQTLFGQVDNTLISVKQSLYELYSNEQVNQMLQIWKAERNEAQEKGLQEYALSKGLRISKLQAIKFFKSAINGLNSYDIVLNPRYSRYHTL